MVWIRLGRVSPRNPAPLLASERVSWTEPDGRGTIFWFSGVTGDWSCRICQVSRPLSRAHCENADARSLNIAFWHGEHSGTCASCLWHSMGSSYRETLPFPVALLFSPQKKYDECYCYSSRPRLSFSKAHANLPTTQLLDCQVGP